MASKTLESFAPETQLKPEDIRHAEDNAGKFIQKHAGNTNFVASASNWLENLKTQTTVGNIITCLGQCPNRDLATTVRAAIQGNLAERGI